jgi:IS30 family transposase
MAAAQEQAHAIRALKAQGKSDRRIADELGLSKSAVQRIAEPVSPKKFGAGQLSAWTADGIRARNRETVR